MAGITSSFGLSSLWCFQIFWKKKKKNECPSNPKGSKGLFPSRIFLEDPPVSLLPMTSVVIHLEEAWTFDVKAEDVS